jgi:hypothetical protein
MYNTRGILVGLICSVHGLGLGNWGWPDLASVPVGSQDGWSFAGRRVFCRLAWSGVHPPPCCRPQPCRSLHDTTRQGMTEQGRKEACDEETKFPGHEGEDKGNDIRGVTDGSGPTRPVRPRSFLMDGEFGRGV